MTKCPPRPGATDAPAAPGSIARNQAPAHPLPRLSQGHARRLLVGAIRRLAAAALLAASSEAAIAQPTALPRAANGHPDMQGLWLASFFTTLERPPGVPLVLGPDDAGRYSDGLLAMIPPVIDPDFATANVRELSNVRGQLRTSQLVEPTGGQLPFTEAALTIVARSQASELATPANPEERATSERCLTGFGQAPFRPFPSIFPMQIVQTDDAVLMVDEASTPRIVNLGGQTPPKEVRSLEGYSRGRWEGDTLIIETTHFRFDDLTRPGFPRPMVVGPDSKVIERMQLIGPDEILFHYTVEDPAYYDQPWLAEYEFRRMPGRLLETACHEGNYALVNMLKAGRIASQH